MVSCIRKKNLKKCGPTCITNVCNRLYYVWIDKITVTTQFSHGNEMTRGYSSITNGEKNIFSLFFFIIRTIHSITYAMIRLLHH